MKSYKTCTSFISDITSASRYQCLCGDPVTTETERNLSYKFQPEKNPLSSFWLWNSLKDMWTQASAETHFVSLSRELLVRNDIPLLPLSLPLRRDFYKESRNSHPSFISSLDVMWKMVGNVFWNAISFHSIHFFIQTDTLSRFYSKSIQVSRSKEIELPSWYRRKNFDGNRAWNRNAFNLWNGSFTSFTRSSYESTP